MEAIFNTLLAFLLLYNYAGIFVISFLAAFLLPLPSSSLLAAAGAFSAQGHFTISHVLTVAFLGNILGDAAGYFIAEKMSRSFLEKIGFKKYSHRNSTCDFLLQQKHFLFLLFSLVDL